MLSKTYRIILYAIVIFAMASVGAGISYPIIDMHWGVSFAILTLIVFLVIESRLGVMQTKEEPQLVEVIEDGEALKRLYSSMREDRECVKMDAVWCTQYTEVPDYFKDERGDFLRNERLHIRRLINPTKISDDPKDFEKHMEDSKELMENGRYEIAATDLEEVECIICEYERHAARQSKALFVFNEQPTNTPRLGILLDPYKSDKHHKISFAVDALKSWFNREWGKGGAIIPLEE